MKEMRCEAASGKAIGSMTETLRDRTTKPSDFFNIRRLFHSGIRRAADVLLPPRCAFCDADLPPWEIDDNACHPSEYSPPHGEILLCRDCRESLQTRDWHWCPRCGSTQTPHYPHKDRCYHCQKVSLSFDAVAPLGQYRNALREVVLRMKRRSYDHLSTTMARLYCLHRGGQVLAAEPDVVVPVPMHWIRRLTRGTNSAEIMAAEIARILQKELVPRALVRCRNTLPQKDLLPEHRARNVLDAFRIVAGYAIQGTRVLLVDDIMTTGATCRETAKVLRRAGAKSVIVAVLARAEGRGHPATDTDTQRKE